MMGAPCHADDERCGTWQAATPDSFQQRIEVGHMQPESFMSKPLPALSESTDLVVEALGKHHDRETIIRALCRRHGVEWREAEAFLRQIESERRNIIARRQAPLILVFAITGLIGGLLMAAYYGLSLVGFVTHPHLLNPSLLLRRIGLFGTGVALMIISTIGLWRPIISFFRK
jgi:hypothetical protein